MKKILLLAFMMLIVVGVQAQDAKALFSKIPDTIFPYLSEIDRSDFFDYLESNMKARVKNKFDSISEMTDLTPDYIRIQATSRSIWEMKLLTVNDSTKIICTVSTACAPACDSSVQFYTTEWKELLVSDYLSIPVMDDFFQNPDSAELSECNNLRLKADMLLVRADLSKENSTLAFTFTTPEYMEDKDSVKMEPCIRKTLVYKWNGRFSR